MKKKILAGAILLITSSAAIAGTPALSKACCAALACCGLGLPCCG